jgi:hypothetical protein
VVDSATHKGVKLRLSPTGKVVLFPANALISLQVEISDNGIDRWTEAQLPPSLESAIQPLATVFLSGTGALQKELSLEGAHAAAAIFQDVECALIDPVLRTVTGNFTSALQDFTLALQSTDFEESARHKTRATAEMSACEDGLRGFEAEQVRPIREAGERLVRLIEKFWEHHLERYAPKPSLLTSKIPPRVTIHKSGEFDLPVRVQLAGNYAPANRVQILLQESAELEYLGGAPSIEILNPGKIETIQCRAVMRSTRQVPHTTLRLRAQLQYELPTGGLRTSAMQLLEYEIVSEAEFAKIVNPYRAYAGGTAVADPNMFFGRTALINEILSELENGPIGQGFALYGQKRTGKTSLIEQIRLRCQKPPLLAVSISLGMLDRTNLTASFARAVLEQVRVGLLTPLNGQDYTRLSRLWPSDERIEQRPIESLMSALIAGRATLRKYPGWAGLRYVLLVDEFTYLFELLRNPEYGDDAQKDVREFLRQWKALLESRSFSSVVVGQDTMPYFMQRFPNEFSAMRALRLSYLDVEETKSLADEPIRQANGASRYTGYALENVYQYTCGHPYFTQVLCDRIVERANVRCQPEISEMAVDEAAESLVSGSSRLDPYRFDCLLTADNSGLVAMRDDDEVVEEQYDPSGDLPYSVLSRLALLAGQGGRSVPIDAIVERDVDRQVLEDLIVRDVVEDNGGLRIRILLFAEYLRQTA